MSFAAPNQILVSRSFYEVIACLSDEYARLFHYLGMMKDKQVREYSVYEITVPERATFRLAPAMSPPSLETPKPKEALSNEQIAIATAALAGYIGPLARVLVKRTAAQCATMEELYRQLAEAITLPNQREAFLRSTASDGTHRGPAPVAASVETSPPGGRPDTGSPNRFNEPFLLALEQELGRRVGPLAKFLVKKQAMGCENEMRLVRQLADELDDRERPAFIETIRSSFPRSGVPCNRSLGGCRTAGASNHVGGFITAALLDDRAHETASSPQNAPRRSASVSPPCAARLPCVRSAAFSRCERASPRFTGRFFSFGRDFDMLCRLDPAADR